MARYGQPFKERVVARLLPPESSPVAEVSTKVGISVATLERWRAEFFARASADQPHRWTPAARLEAVIGTAGLDATARAAWCREHGEDGEHRTLPRVSTVAPSKSADGSGRQRHDEATEGREQEKFIAKYERQLP